MTIRKEDVACKTEKVSGLHLLFALYKPQENGIDTKSVNGGEEDAACKKSKQRIMF